MSEFLTELEASLKDDDTVWILDKELVYHSDLVGTITVPAGFETDFASVPKIPLFYMLYGNRAHREGVVHDFLYRKDCDKWILFNQFEKAPVSFSMANRVFFEAMKCRGKGSLVRYGMTLGVYIGGWFSYWKKNVMDKL